MTRPCSICGRPDRAAIDAGLEVGMGLGTVATRYGVGRSALQRHRESHLGRTLTVRLPPNRPTVSAPAPGNATGGHETASGAEPPPLSVHAIDLPATVGQLFDAAAASAEERGIQAYVHLAFAALTEAYAIAHHTRDPNVLARVGRDLMKAVATHAAVPVDKLRELPGWKKPPEVRDTIHFMEQMLWAHILGKPERVAMAEAQYEEACDAWNAAHPGKPDNRNLRFGLNPATPTQDMS